MEATDAEIEPWSHELSLSAAVMDQCRQRYLGDLLQALSTCLREIGTSAGTTPVEVRYERGWPEGGLFEQLQQNLARDRRYGHTTLGPHKADLIFSVAGSDVAEVYSRGQLKVLVCILKIVQSQHLAQTQGVTPLFLLDDLPAELDAESRDKVCWLLASLRAQVFITSIEQEALTPIARKQTKSHDLKMSLFHVKHGKIDAV